MSWLSSFLHPEKGYQKAQEQLDKYYNQTNVVYNLITNMVRMFTVNTKKPWKNYDPGGLQDE